MKVIEKAYNINAPVEKVWDALINPEIIETWGAGPDVQMSDVVGSEFSIWGGDIFGKNVEIVENQLLKQEWYGSKDWNKPSIVTFDLRSKEDSTILKLTHTDFPEQVDQESFESFASGWDDYYVGPLKELVEKESS